MTLLKENTQTMTFKYFSRDEFACQATGENEIDDELIYALDDRDWET